MELVLGDFLLLLFDKVFATPVIEVPGDFRGGFPFSMSVDMLLRKSTEKIIVCVAKSKPKAPVRPWHVNQNFRDGFVACAFVFRSSRESAADCSQKLQLDQKHHHLIDRNE